MPFGLFCANRLIAGEIGRSRVGFRVLLAIACALPGGGGAQAGQGLADYWQQEVRYTLDMRLDVGSNQMTGTADILYVNHSPDILDRVFFHLYFNAFRPGSEMDIRSRTISDPDPRVRDRISLLKPDEAGYMHVQDLTQDGRPLMTETQGTILEVRLARPLKPGQRTRFRMAFDAQVPLQIRRNGRDNSEGIRYSMAQAYPKLCAYDRMGWHADPYVGREFYGNWGDFDVRITLDSSYTVAASGELRNARTIGHGYAPTPAQRPRELTWHFVARNVHDFLWAADPDYVHGVHSCANGVVLHTFYRPDERYRANWEKLPAIMEAALDFANTHYGRYPYPVYSFVQGGDGGMEYPMATLITGNRNLASLVGVSIHEMMHSWYQGVLGFNETHYYWMDEGFTQYTSEIITEHLKSLGLLPGETDPNPIAQFYSGYANLVSLGIEEPLSTHADHFGYNTAYSLAAYTKGAVFLQALQYVIGKPAFDQGMLAFYERWKFRHPDDVAFIRVMEDMSGIELDWFREYMVNSIKTVDYAIDSVFEEGGKTVIRLRREGDFPMPVDLEITRSDGTRQWFHIPLDLMRGVKQEPAPDRRPMITAGDWVWVDPTYELVLDSPLQQIRQVEIDPSGRMADLDHTDNRWPTGQ